MFTPILPFSQCCRRNAGHTHAWLAARLFDKQARSYDWRWRIEVEEATRDTPFASLLSPVMDGRSAEGTLTCALLAAGRGDELDRNTSMSASLELPLQSTLKLSVVDGLDIKTLADRLQRKHIRDFIVSDLQSDVDLDTGSGHHFIRTATVADAMDHFCIWPRITRAVRDSIHREATTEREKLCGPPVPPEPPEQQAERGTDYVQSPIGIRLPDRERSEGQLRAEPQPLTDDQIRQFVRCQWRPNGADETEPVRLQLFADSGMGKTIQLLICEQTIAADDTQRVPIRLGRRASLTHVGPERGLDSIEWRGVMQENLQQLASLLKRHIPDEHKDRAEPWVRRMVELGQFVYLLDALDQHRGLLTHLATFLAESDICQCPAIVAGRPESLTSRGEVFLRQT